ncbi:MAG: hypothetical protein ABFD49_05560 [Armatimonadota bacterium]|nr:hypothetical protein [bacterium]
MRRIMLVMCISAIALIAGCGGGGGGSTSTSLSTLSSDITGAWQVENLSLPDNEIIVEEDGDVVVDSDSPQTIGTCSSLGVLNLSGSWVSSDVQHTIEATGAINTSTSQLSICATVTQADETMCENATVIGTRTQDADDDEDDEEMDVPPAPPY